MRPTSFQFTAAFLLLTALLGNAQSLMPIAWAQDSPSGKELPEQIAPVPSGGSPVTDSSQAADATKDDSPFHPPQNSGPKFIILLGKDVSDDNPPFTDAYSLQTFLQQYFTVSIENISVDIESELPTVPGVSLGIKIPELNKDQTLDSVRKQYLAKAALPFGITRVNVEVDPSIKTEEATLQIGITSLNSVDWNKYLAVATLLGPSTKIELFNEAPLVNDMTGMGGMGGMGMSGSDLTMSAGRVMMSGGMGGMPGGMGMGGMGNTFLSWAQPTGLLEENKLLVSWALKDKLAAAIDTERSTDWQRITIDGDAITNPILSSDICLFLTETTAYGFSRIANQWSTHPVKWSEDAVPVITFSSQLARVSTKDEVFVFTSAGKWFTRSEATDPNAVDARPAASLLSTSQAPPLMAAPSIAPAATSPPPTVQELQSTISMLRGAVDGLRKEAEVLKARHLKALEEDDREQIRQELSQKALSLVTSEAKLQEAELRLIERKIQRLANQIAERMARRNELADEQLYQWIGE